jgi:hypothetical protein
MAFTVMYSGAIGFVMPLALPAFDHVRYRFYKRRLERRLARDPYMLREEYRDHILGIGGEPEPLGPVVWSAAAAGLACAAGAWAYDLKMEDLWEAAWALFFAVLAAWSLWRLHNAPDEMLAEADCDNTPDAQRLWGWGGFGVALLGMWFAAYRAGWL